MDHYSYSKIDTYAGCPRRFKLRYIEKRPEQPSEALERGKAVHEAIAEYTRHVLAEGVQTDLEFLRSIQGTDEVMEILETFAGTHMIEPGDYTFEEMWRLSMAPHPWTWWGVIDNLKDEGDRLVITDYKTDFQVRSAADVAKDEQLRDYAWMAAMKFPGAQEFACGIDFVRHGVLRQVIYTRDDIPAIEKSIIARIEAIEADREYNATPGIACGYCSYTDSCPAVTHGGGVEAVTSADDAGRAGAELIALKARVKSIEDLLKPWASANGAVEVNGMEIGFFLSESYEYPTDEFVAVCDSSEVDYRPLLKVDTTKVKALAKRDERFAEALAAIAIDKSSTRFTTRKVKS